MQQQPCIFMLHLTVRNSFRTLSTTSCLDYTESSYDRFFTLAYTFLERELKVIGNRKQYWSIFGHDGDEEGCGDSDIIVTADDAPLSPQ